MELIISVLSFFIGKGGERGGGGFRGITAFFRRNGRGMGVSLRQQSIKGGLEKIDCQLPTYYQCGGGGGGISK